MTPDEIPNLRSLRNRCQLVTRRSQRRIVTLRPEASAEWIYDEDSVRHRSGGFFRILGLRYADTARASPTLCQPIIDQPEVGLLSLGISEPGAAAQVLVQLKCEPGNVGGVQLAPTCQATQSNLTRIHGGSLPPGARLMRPGVRMISDSLQSEQGTRFWRKRNRNVVMAATLGSVPDDDQHLCWLSLPLLRQALAADYLVNTDARSVLATTHWEEVMGEQPFASASLSDVLEPLLHKSWRSQSTHEAYQRAETVMDWLERRRIQVVGELSLVPIAVVPALRSTGRGLSWGAKSSSFDIRHVSVSILGREQEHWDQPLIDSRGVGSASLFVFQRQGELLFIFRAACEPGLHDRVELQPALCRAPGAVSERDSAWLVRLARAGIVMREVRQSDEGGRFWRDITVYRVVAIADPGPLPDGFVALTPREIGLLAPRGVFTNEARSTISLLFSRY